MAGKSVPQILEEIGALLEIKGENPFKSRAYYNAAKTLSGIDNLDGVIQEKRLKEIKGIGETLSGNIEEYFETGRMAYFEELTKQVPDQIPEELHHIFRHLQDQHFLNRVPRQSSADPMSLKPLRKDSTRK